ncbi:MAG: hypothetical protein PHF86_07240 [Candidatus Nanoarchaeia archaeon]|jgi:hypothetical protein|nr:hypothetical protein [Candidatus Nanoarchaeia archaeon]
MKNMLICPKSNVIVDINNCIALQNLSKSTAEIFVRKICLSVQGCPKEDYCNVFECGLNAAGELLRSTIKD